MKRVTKNMLVAFATKIIIILTGIIAQRFMLKSFGSAINGLTSTISQIMFYVELLEVGLGTASIQALYKPLANNDKSGISGIYNATAYSYRKIGFAFMTVWTAVSLVLPFFVNTGADDLTYWLIVAIVALSGVGHVLRYMFMGKWSVILHADNRIYSMHYLDIATHLVNCVIKVYMINAGYGVIPVLSLNLVWVFMRMIIMYVYIKKHYGYLDRKIEPDFEATKKRKNILVHQIVGMVANHTDMLLLSFFSTLQMVSVYSVYNYVYSNINNIIQTTFAQAPLATFGRLYAREDSRLKQYFRSFEVLFYAVMFTVLVTAGLLTIPFVKLYTAGVTDVKYVDIAVAILFVVIQSLNLIRVPATIIINVSGRYKETQRGAILEAVINLALSIPLFFRLGMKGLLIGTVVSLLYRSADIIYYVYKYIFNQKLTQLCFIVINYCIVGALAIIIHVFVLRPDITSWVEWLIWGCITAVIVAVLYLINTIIFYKKHLKNLKVLFVKRG